MRKVIAATILSLFTLSAFAAPPAKVKIDAAKKKQPAVTFTHDKHVKLAKACDTCHHTNKGLTAESKAKVEKCSTCHLNPKDAKVLDMADGSLTKNPYHKLCISCHKTAKKGPAACNKCHVKS
jgi:hypothetical protein